MKKQPNTLAGVIELLYNEFLARYRVEEVASVATAATINELLLGQNKENAAS
jgi:hypothetical protein